MSDDDKPPMPPQPTTKQLPKAVPLTSDTANTILASIAAVAASVDDLKTDFASYKSEVDERFRNSSIKVRAQSSSNLEQDAAIASIIREQGEAKKRDESTQQAIALVRTDLAKNSASTEIIRSAVTGIGGFFKAHPALVSAIAGALTAAAGALAHWFTVH